MRRFLRGDYAPAALLTVLALVVGVFVAGQNGRYLTEVNFNNFLYLVAALGLVSLGQFVVVATGGIDLSVGPLVALTTVVSSYLIVDEGAAPLLIGLGAVAVTATVVGLTNGLLIVKVRISPVIATLITFFALQGIALLLRLTPDGLVATTLADLPIHTLGFVPVVVLPLLALVAVLEWRLRRSPWGLRLRAVGSDAGVAHRIGVPVTRTTITAYVMCSLLAAAGGIVFTGLIAVGDATAGINYTLTSIAAVILGGAAVTGGRGSFLGVLAGAVVLQQTANVSTFLSLGSQWQYWFVGLLVLAAATFYSQVRGAAGRRRRGDIHP